MKFVKAEVLRVRKLTKRMYELYARYDVKPEPGTFVMVWLPGFEAIPLSVAGWVRNTIRFIIDMRGPTTKALYNATKIGISEPLGRRAPVPLSRPVYVAGGVGLAPFLYMKQVWGGKLLFGARNKEFVPPLDEIDEVATDDGSVGFKGSVVDLFFERPQKRDVYVCGPPKMIEYFESKAKKFNIKAYFSTETPVKCGIGICGACTIRGKLLCRDLWIRVG